MRPLPPDARARWRSMLGLAHKPARKPRKGARCPDCNYPPPGESGIVLCLKHAAQHKPGR